MNAERLHVIAKAIKEDLTSTSQESQLQQLVNALATQVNQPQQPAYQQQVVAVLKSLSTALDSAPSNEFSPTWRQALDAMGVTELLGRPLRERVQSAFARNQITPAVALQELQAIFQEVGQFRAALEQLLAALTYFEIAAEQLGPGECEVGVLVPRAYVNNQLPDFIGELHEIEQILGVFAELTTKSRPAARIKTISSSDLSIFLESTPIVAAALAAAAERILALYKNLLEIRKLQQDLRERGLAEKNLRGIDDHANGLMEGGIDKIVGELIKQYKGDGGRKNELTIELKMTLHKIANRIDRGFNIEVRAGPPIEKEPKTEGEPVDPDAPYLKTIADAAKGLQFLKLEGSPILSLPEGEPHEGKKKDHK